MRSGRRKTIVFGTITIILALCAYAVVAELVLRFLPVQTGLRALAVDDRNPIARFTPNRTFVFSRGWRLSLANRGRVNNVGFVNDQDYDSTSRTPLLAVVGDSYVEALMVPYDSTLQGRLARTLAGRARVYSFAMSGAPLSQYLAWADYARRTYRPTGLVVVVVLNDFDESLLKYRQAPGYYHFRQAADSALSLERLDYRPSRVRQLLRQSALARYIFMNGPSLLAARVSGVAGNTSADTNPVRVHDSERAVDAFLAQLPARAGLPSRRIALVVDAVRPALYDPHRRAAAAATYAGRLRRYLIDHGRETGFEVLDMEPVFAAHYARDGTRFEYAVDAHWSAVGHRVAAEAVMASSVFREFQTAPARGGATTRAACPSEPCAAPQPRTRTPF